MKSIRVFLIFLIMIASTSCASSGTESDTQTEVATPVVIHTTMPTVALPTGTATIIPTSTPVVITYENLCDYNQKRVVISGYIHVGTGVSFLDLATKEYMILLSQDSNGTNPVSLSIRVGDGENQIEELFDGYDYTDVIIHMNDGAIIGNNTYVTVTGKAKKYGPSCVIDIETIE